MSCQRNKEKLQQPCISVAWPARHQLFDDQSVFNYRFGGCTALLLCSTAITKLPATFANPPHWPADKPCEHDVSLPVRQKIKKAPGPDSMSPYCLKVCSDQLAPHLHTDLQEILHHKINWLQAYCSVVCGHPSRVWCQPTWKWTPCSFPTRQTS